MTNQWNHYICNLCAHRVSGIETIEMSFQFLDPPFVANVYSEVFNRPIGGLHDHPNCPTWTHNPTQLQKGRLVVCMWYTLEIY